MKKNINNVKEVKYMYEEEEMQKKKERVNVKRTR
jgi:hypothetical protein